MSQFSRRTVAAFGALLLAGVVASSGNGETVKTDTTPQRIIASGPEAAALISYGIRPVGLYAGGPIKDDLAVSLGADLDTPEIAANKKAFDEALAGFKKAVADKPGLTALAVSPSDDLLYVAVPKHAPELLDFQRWGLDIINPDNPDKGFPYWENLSWENVDKYQPDVLLIDGRTYDSSVKLGEKQPTWNSIKAGKAKSYILWPAYWMHTYKEYAEQLELLTAAIEKADAGLA